MLLCFLNLPCSSSVCTVVESCSLDVNTADDDSVPVQAPTPTSSKGHCYIDGGNNELVAQSNCQRANGNILFACES